MGAVALLCSVSDAALILAGVTGIGTIVERAPVVLDVVRWAGAAFLMGYAVLALRRAVHPGELHATTGGPPVALRPVLTTAAALTFLNPHVYLDTVLLVGSIANQHGDPGRCVFAFGAVLGSFLWFFGLAYGAGRLAPLFARPAAWRFLDGLIAVVMATIAVSLLLGG